MKPFMDYIQEAFYSASKWDPDNSYSSLTATANALLFFETPRGLRLNVSSLASPNLATSHALGSVGLVNGSLSYLYSSLPLRYTAAKSVEINLHDIVQGYRYLQELRVPEASGTKSIWQNGFQTDRKDTLLYGRLFLPRSTLEALYMRRLSPTRQLKLSCVSDSGLKHGATVLGILEQDVGKYSTEYLLSTDSGLLGVRGLYNFGPDPRHVRLEDMPVEQLYGRFSAGAEVYYGLFNKSGGVSTGLRFTTLPRHTGFPYTMTLTLNPLMGNLSSTYAVKAGQNVAFCSQFDFNFYSYESDLQLGCEIWRRKQEEAKESEVSWAEKLVRPGWKRRMRRSDEDVSGVLKARWKQDWKMGLLWEGRIKELLVSLGASVDLHRREQIFDAVGVELRYSS